MTVYRAPELGATDNNRMGVKRQPVPRAISAFKMAVKRMSLVYNRPVWWGGSRGSNEPPKIFEVGILGG